MKENCLFSPDQSGFLRLHSTLTCLLKNTDDWYSGLDLGQLMGLIFIDLKKAFDTVDHEILCKKLQIYGVQHRELSWVWSYLPYRKQFCRVNGVASDIKDIEVGVPQGSYLRPLLFQNPEFFYCQFFLISILFLFYALDLFFYSSILDLFFSILHLHQ